MDRWVDRWLNLVGGWVGEVAGGWLLGGSTG